MEIICQYCRTENFDPTRVCIACGKTLLDVNRPEDEASPPYVHSASDAFGRPSISTSKAGSLFATLSSRVIFVVSCFAFAIGVGLFGAWWMNDHAIVRALAAKRKSGQPPDGGLVKPLQTPHAARQSFGISAGELPYDGVPPNLTADIAIKPKPHDLQEANPKSGINGNAENAASVAHHVAPPKQPQEKAAMTTTGDVPNNAAPQASPRKPIKSVQRQGASAKLARSKEIDRLKQQAENELKKKTERRRALAQKLARARQQEGRREARAAALRCKQAAQCSPMARCNNIAGLFAREACKWRICKGKWGKNGCPSYARQGNY